MEDLINISNYCDAMLVKYGQSITKCNAVYIKDEDIIMFNMQYHIDSNKNHKTYQYSIPNFDFLITDTEVLVNRSAIDKINIEIEKRINQIELKYNVNI